MHDYSLTHLSDADLTRDIAALVTRDRVGTALLLAHLAEFDARKLFRPAGYSSMFAYCVEELHFSEPEAARRIRAARAVREFPLLLSAVAAGRLHLSGLCLLGPHPTSANVEQMIEAAAHRSKREIEGLLARCFPEALPQEDGQVLIRRVRLSAVPSGDGDTVPLFESLDSQSRPDNAAAGAPTDPSHAGPDVQPVPLESADRDTAADSRVSGRHKEHLPGDVPPHLPGDVPPSKETTVQAPLIRCPEADRFLLRLTISTSTHEKLREAQALLSHAVRQGEVAEVLDRALSLLLVHLKRRRFGLLRER